MFENLPRNTTRSGYLGLRSHLRCQDESREERGLPLHPVNCWASCPDCLGTGEHAHNDSGTGDPQRDSGVACGRCCGEGELADGLIDPLMLVAKYRKGRFNWAMSARRAAGRRHYYDLYRLRAMRPSSGLLLADMRALVQICADDTDRAVKAMQVAA
ncbi:hypothetical protein ABE494_07525 [Stenotrophomonas lactitubi]|uniref:hypothetical protein n=1 Tax=Stenotrophomonas lactitubi TaxID=2045214 RepID=UPI00320A3CDA